jgi:hypothetical protein
MSIRWYSVVVHWQDIKVQSRWSAEVLDWRIAFGANPEGSEFCVLTARG